MDGSLAKSVPPVRNDGNKFCDFGFKHCQGGLFGCSASHGQGLRRGWGFGLDTTKIVADLTREVGDATPEGTGEIAHVITERTIVAKNEGRKASEEAHDQAFDKAIDFHGNGNQPEEILIETDILVHLASALNRETAPTAA